ncbi:MAG: hypothetical protein MZV65_28275 [Chromatiales bacterium]|nr:hypothetical protein [Chromatiales bacterium]
MLAVALTLLLLDRSETDRDLLIAGGVVAVAFLTRGYAVVLLPVGILFILFRPNGSFVERIKYAVFFSIPMLAAIFAWAGYTHIAIASGQIDGSTARYGSDGSGFILAGLDAFASRLFTAILLGRRSAFIISNGPTLDAKTVRNSFPLFIGSVGLLALVGLGWALSLRRPLSSVTIWFPAKIAMMWVIAPCVSILVAAVAVFVFSALLAVYYLSQQTHRLKYAYLRFCRHTACGQYDGFYISSC